MSQSPPPVLSKVTIFFTCWECLESKKMRFTDKLFDFQLPQKKLWILKVNKFRFYLLIFMLGGLNSLVFGELYPPLPPFSGFTTGHFRLFTQELVVFVKKKLVIVSESGFNFHPIGILQYVDLSFSSYIRHFDL